MRVASPISSVLLFLLLSMPVDWAGVVTVPHQKQPAFQSRPVVAMPMPSILLLVQAAVRLVSVSLLQASPRQKLLQRNARSPPNSFVHLQKVLVWRSEAFGGAVLRFRLNEAA